MTSFLQRLRSYWLEPKVGILEAAKREYAWRKLRNEHVARNPRCAMCGTLKDPEAHHILPWSTHPDRRFDPTNLITLCACGDGGCHVRYGHMWNFQHYNSRVVELCARSKEIRDAEENDAIVRDVARDPVLDC